MKHYDSGLSLNSSASLRYEINQLDQNKLYNMITLNPDTLKIKNMTYLINIKVKQPVKLNDTDLSYLLKSINISYQFNL